MLVLIIRIVENTKPGIARMSKLVLREGQHSAKASYSGSFSVILITYITNAI